MKLLIKLLPIVLFPLALFAALPPTAEDLREMRAIVDSPVLNQILSPDEGLFFIRKDPEETEQTVYILESTSHTIGVVVSHKQLETRKPGFVGPVPIQLQFYATSSLNTNEEPRGLTFKEIFGSSEAIVAEEGGTPSQDPDVARVREILNSPDLYSELDGARVEYIIRNHELSIEEIRNDIAEEQDLDEKAMAIKEALDKASLEKSEVYLIVATHKNTETTLKLLAFVIYPEDSETTKPSVFFFQVPDQEAGD